METLKIQFETKNRAKIIEMLSSFPENEVQIVREDSFFEENKKKLHLAYDNLISGKSKLYAIDELDEMLEKTISKYEG